MMIVMIFIMRMPHQVTWCTTIATDYHYVPGLRERGPGLG
jgi:hypothetical protein